jgi:O-antigen/teichoic acid export membrane protein
VSAALLFRHLGVVDGGRYVTVLSLIALVGGLTEGGLTAIGVREFATGTPDARAAALRALLGMRVTLTIAGVAVAVGFAGVAGYPAVLVLGTALAGIGLLIQSVQTAATIPLQAELRFGWVTATDLLRQFTTVVAVVALVLAGAALLPFLAIAIPAALASLALTVAAVRQRDALIPSFRPSAWSGLIRETLPYAITSAVGAIYFRLAIIIMSLVAADVETGYFGASFRIVDVLIVIPQLLVGAVFPIFARAARDDRDRMRYAMQRSFDGTLIAGVWTAVALVIGAEFAIKVVAGPEFAPAAEVLRIQSLALLLAFVNAVIGYALLSLGMYRALLVMASAALIAMAVATPPLGSAHGAVGGAIATVIGELVVTAGGVLALARSHGDLLPSPGRAARILLAGALALAVVALGLPDVLGVVLATAVFAAGLLALRAIPEELIDEARAQVRRLRRQEPADS